jgi:hypothetical protein
MQLTHLCRRLKHHFVLIKPLEFLGRTFPTQQTFEIGSLLLDLLVSHFVGH